jgi:SAM-dependent methyltransferase
MSPSDRSASLTPHLSSLIGSDTLDDYHWTSGWNTAVLQTLVGLRVGQRLLDVGCGSGRLARGLYGWFGDDYVGVDIVPELIEYCRGAFPRFRFEMLDLESDFYNPAAETSPALVQLDFPDESFDVITMFSLITHVTTEVTARYFAESRRLLAPGGSLFFTCFLLNEAAARSPVAHHRFPHHHDGGCYYEDEKVVSAAVAYDERAIHALLTENDLAIVFQEGGTWTGHTGLAFQDIVIAQRSDDTGSAV